MRYLLVQLSFILFLTTSLFGQSSERPQSIVIPISSIGEVSETRKQILQNTLTQELSKHFQILPQDQFERVQEKVFEELEYDECTEDQCIIRIQEILQIENVFNLQVIGEEGDTQLNLKWMNLDEKKNREDYCEGCKTKELRKRVKELVGQLVGLTESKQLGDIPQTKRLNLNEKINITLYRNHDRDSWEKEGKKWFRLGNEETMNRYEGETINGIPNGYGYIIFTNGDTFEGEFVDGEYINGRYIFKSGSVYDGGFKNEILHGSGTYKYKEGDLYIGKFINGLKEGQGSYFWKNGNKFIGLWKNDNFWSGKLLNEKTKKILSVWENGLKKNPEGVLFRKYSKDQSSEWKWFYRGDTSKDWKYEGEILKDSPNGKGILIYKKEKYVGNFKNGRFNGYGEYTYQNGGKYKGMWINGERFGEGEYFSHNGDRYIGYWRNDKPFFVKGYDKNNKIFYNDSIETGVLYKRLINGNWIWDSKGNNKVDGKYWGEFLKNEPHGQGKFISPKGETYHGEWVNGKYDGKGTWTLKTSRYTGGWKEGERHGEGIFIDLNRNKFQGIWNNGEILKLKKVER